MAVLVSALVKLNGGIKPLCEYLLPVCASSVKVFAEVTVPVLIAVRR